jgi:hypothetical protein
VLFCQIRRIAAEARDHAVDFRVVDERSICRRVVVCADAHAAHRARGARGAMHHGTCLLRQPHARHQVSLARVRCQPPVLEGLERAGPVEIAKAQAVAREDRRASGVEARLRRRSERRLRLCVAGEADEESGEYDQEAGRGESRHCGDVEGAN